MTEDLPIVHIRRPGLPWRESTKTECGLPIAGHPVVTRPEFLAKYKKQGRQRCLLTTCQTCLDTANRHPAWEDDPVASLGREVEGHNRRRWVRPVEEATFMFELRAIAILIEKHRAEFDELLEDQRQIVPIASGRG